MIHRQHAAQFLQLLRLLLRRHSSAGWRTRDLEPAADRARGLALAVEAATRTRCIARERIPCFLGLIRPWRGAGDQPRRRLGEGRVRTVPTQITRVFALVYEMMFIDGNAARSRSTSSALSPGASATGRASRRNFTSHRVPHSRSNASKPSYVMAGKYEASRN